MSSYETCPSCNTAILTAEYKKRYGQCRACYEREHTPLGIRISNALR